MLQLSLKKAALATLAVGAVIFASSCTSMVTEEQLIMLQDLRDQKASLSAEIKRVQDDTRALQSQLNAAKATADDCERRRKYVEDKLKNWPNSWPDFNPNELSAPNTRRTN